MSLGERALSGSVQILPALREECEQSAKCLAATKHFQHCEEKVNAGKGYAHEDCTEELYVARSLVLADLGFSWLPSVQLYVSVDDECSVY